ncbi:MAG: serine/threonine protein kinase [Myxococcales bacterium]|nr:serine/threonine protein kinase [Myxococcales bacterium]
MSAAETIGMQFGPYLLRQRLGVGGMASVWRAIDEGGRTLVVKRILPSLAEDAEFVAMFDREARLSARMRHPNIVRIYDHGDYEGERYLAMEHLHGKDVTTAMMELTRKCGTPRAGLGAYVAREVCRALSYVHALTDEAGAALNLIHRDVSLSNVMLGFDGSVKLLDFGVAKALADDRAARTQAGVLKGKWAYLAPEQIEAGTVDHRADVFATGIVMWEMLTGKRLFKAASGLQTLEKVRAAKVMPPSALNPAVTPELDAICLKALSKSPHDRYASAAAMAEALDPVVEALSYGGPELALQLRGLFAADAATQTADADGDTQLSPVGASLDALRLPPSRWARVRAHRWQMLLAAMVALALGAMTGWQIAHAGGMR